MKNRFRSVYGLVFTLVLLTIGYSCSDKPDTEAKVEYVKVPTFNADSAYRYVQEQVDFGPRVPNTEAHKLCGDYLIRKLEKFGAKVLVQNFEAVGYDGVNYELRNIIGSYNLKAAKRILLAAHWDTRKFADKDTERINEPIDGANDGASGVAVLLELARTINEAEGPEVGIDILFFDGEDNGVENGYTGSVAGENPEFNGWCLGSQYWSKNKHKPNYTAYYGVLLDMVGAKNARFLREMESMRYAPDVVKKVWDKGNELGYGRNFVYRDGGGVTDDHIFVNTWGKIKMIDIIELNEQNNFGAYHHTHMDNMSVIDKRTLDAVGETVLNVIYFE